MCISTTYSIPRKHESYDTSINVIGIDFGASNCCAAVIRKKGIVTLPLDNYGETRIPSYISFDEEKAKFGKAAVDRLFSFAEYTVFDLKRLIGRSYDKKLIDATWPFEIVNDNNNIKIRYLNHLNQFTIKSPEELVSEFLRYIKERFFEYQGKKENPTTVITIPAGYNENQKQATLKAAKLAGFDKIYLLPEPVAATIAYAIDHPFPKNASILLFKLGHVTFEICILKVNNSQLQIISHTSDPNIGGRNFDIIIFEYFKKELYSRYEIDIQNDDEKYKHRQLSESRKIKHALDVRNEELIDVEDFNRNTEGIINITRKDFEAKSIQLIEKMQKLVVQALNKAKLQSYQINQIYRVGGASRMQMVKDMLLRMFPDAVHCEEEYPGESVAIGAAHYSYQLAGSIAVQSPHFFRRFFY
uniref:Hypoxia up-regulated protein 1 n=1 Tax=Panagrolaimus davidi TaxID=227884 RepID=A0A914PAE9_9BILA